MSRSLRWLVPLTALATVGACSSPLERSTIEPMVTDDVVAAWEPMEVETYPDAELGAAQLEPAATRTAPQPETTVQPAADEGATLGVVFVELEPELARLCPRVDRAKAFFAFDSARLQPQAEDQLQALAECLQSGVLADRSLEVVGTADPRGSFEYNYELGKARATSVADYLQSRGLASDRMQVMSVGETFASPHDLTSYQYERRVVVQLDDDPPEAF